MSRKKLFLAFFACLFAFATPGASASIEVPVPEDPEMISCKANGSWCNNAEECCSGKCYINKNGNCCVCGESR